MEVQTGVYRILNSVTGDCYVGSAAKSFATRWTQHRNGLRAGNHRNSHLQRAFNKYGEAAFSFSVLETAEPKDCVALEQVWIDSLSPEYNICRVAGSSLGVVRSQHTRDVLSSAKSKLSEAQIKDVLQSYQRGEEIATIAARVGIHYVRVHEMALRPLYRRIKAEIGFDAMDRTRDLWAQVAWGLKARMAGMTPTEIAQHLGVKPTWVAQFCSRPRDFRRVKEQVNYVKPAKRAAGIDDETRHWLLIQRPAI